MFLWKFLISNWLLDNYQASTEGQELGGFDVETFPLLVFK